MMVLLAITAIAVCHLALFPHSRHHEWTQPATLLLAANSGHALLAVAIRLRGLSEGLVLVAAAAVCSRLALALHSVRGRRIKEGRMRYELLLVLLKLLLSLQMPVILVHRLWDLCLRGEKLIRVVVVLLQPRARWRQVCSRSRR